jgi:hypothetical protein
MHGGGEDRPLLRRWVCTNCGAWLWAVLAGIAATEAFRHEFQGVSSAAWPSATVKRFS